MLTILVIVGAVGVAMLIISSAVEGLLVVT
jgi:hypothetical protein